MCHEHPKTTPPLAAVLPSGSALKAHCERGDEARALEVLRAMRRAGRAPTLSSYASLAALSSRVGSARLPVVCACVRVCACARACVVGVKPL